MPDCPICGKTYKSETWLTKHMNAKHGKTEIPEVSIVKREPLYKRQVWRLELSDGSMIEKGFTVEESLEMAEEIARAEKKANGGNPRIGWFKRLRMKRRAKKYKNR